MLEGDHDDDDHDTTPSPEEIERACVVIRASWSDAERRRRRTGSPAKTVDTQGVKAMALQRLEASLLERRLATE